MDDFGKILKQWIREAYGTQKAFSIAMNMPDSQISTFVSGKAMPGGEILAKFARAGFDLNKAFGVIEKDNLEQSDNSSNSSRQIGLVAEPVTLYNVSKSHEARIIDLEKRVSLLEIANMEDEVVLLGKASDKHPTMKVAATPIVERKEK